MATIIVDTGTSNNASVLAALRAADPDGQVPMKSTSPDDVRTAARVVVPGVATFGNAMAALEKHGLVEPLRERILSGKPTLCVCVGLQILAASSDESPGVAGLGIFPSCHIRKFPTDDPTVLVPQQGWNRVSRVQGERICYRFLTRNGHAYFSNSFAMAAIPLGGWHVATTTHGIPFVSALERGNVLACQFHPELSGDFGSGILKAWLKKTAPAVLAAAAPASAPASSRAKGPASTLTRRVIPCLDVKNGRVVKGVSFEGLRDAGDPVELCKAYETQGADELVMLDISATPSERATSVQTVRDINAACLLPLTVGGGIRDVASAQRLLDAGADKISVNTAAVKRPAFLTELAASVGKQCTVLAIDARRREESAGGAGESWEVVVKSGKERTGIDVVEWAVKGVELGAGEILLTSFDRDGRGTGFDCALLRAVSSAVRVPVIASGGGKTAQHMVDAFVAGADAVLAATIFHFQQTTVCRLKDEVDALAGAGAGAGAGAAHRVALRRTATRRKTLTPRAQTVIPSIDLMSGHAVQLVGGDPQKLEVDAGDPQKLIRRFGIAGEVAVIDLDAAFGKGKDNVETIRQLVATGIPCRVGGGIRTVDKALDLLNAGVTKVIVGTAASAEFCAQLPRDRVMVALDARHGEVVTHGWTTKTGATIEERLQELAPYASSFLVTFVEREGRLAGCDFPAIQRLVDIAAASDKPVALTVAGGVATPEDIATLDKMGVQAQVGMALYKRKMLLGDAIAAPLQTDRPDGLFATVVCDESSRVLGLAYSSKASIRAAVEQCAGAYWSRSRNNLWVKGKTSGDTQELLRIDMDCDRDALRFIVRPAHRHGGFCHVPDQVSCFGQVRGLAALEASIFSRHANAPPKSYTARLFRDAALLENKLLEEAGELAEAMEPSHVAEEYADVLYFAMVKAVSRGVTIADMETCLDRRALKVKRRKGDAKPKGHPGRREKPNKKTKTTDGQSKAKAPSSSSSSGSSSGSKGGRFSGTLERISKETTIQTSVQIDGTGKADVATGLGFLDHMVSALSKHSGMDITLHAKGDLHVCDHHTVEDCGIMLGRAVDAALGERRDIARWGWALCPLDEALARAVVDVSGRPFCAIDLKFEREMIGAVSTEMLTHFVQSFTQSSRLTIHLTVLEGKNDHHRAESAFKALAVGLKMAFAIKEGVGVLSTKDCID